MGYETKLLIGSEGYTSPELARGELTTEGDEAYRPYLKDENDSFIETGRKETYFQVYAEIDLCKCGQGAIHKIDRVNKDASHFWYWYEGSKQTTEDSYGDKPKPIPIETVIEAIEKHDDGSGYRRFKWALSLLNSMRDDKESGISVLLIGH